MLDFWFADFFVKIFKILRQVWIFIRILICFESISEHCKIFHINIKTQSKNRTLNINKVRKVN
jgi:hypothetical protein